MEPCLFRHGKEPGHDPRHRPGDASMEPCLFRHGKSAHVLPIDPAPTDASMEPCLFRHGKGASSTISNHSRRLQWSHVFSDMVSRRRVHCGADALRGFNGAMSFQTW